MAQVPVFHMNIEESKAAATTTYKGKTYYFWQSAARRGLKKSLKSMLKKQGDMSKGNIVIK